MSNPDSNDILLEPAPLSREQQFLITRLQDLAAIASDAEAALAPFVNSDIARVEKRIADLFVRANKLLQWRDFKSADVCSRQISGALLELRSLGMQQGVNRLYFERVCTP